MNIALDPALRIQAVDQISTFRVGRASEYAHCKPPLSTRPKRKPLGEGEKLPPQHSFQSPNGLQLSAERESRTGLSDQHVALAHSPHFALSRASDIPTSSPYPSSMRTVGVDGHGVGQQVQGQHLRRSGQR